jgi:two-component system, NarL family, sensor histidine kinase UhpB
MSGHLAVLVNRTLAERALSESEARFRTFWEHSILPMVLGAPDGTFRAANPAACRLFGRSEEEMRRIGRDGMVDFTDGRVYGILGEREASGRAQGEMSILTADGSRVPVLTSTAAYMTAEGPRVCLTYLDLSAMKKAEGQVRAFSRRLLSSDEEEKRRISAALHHDVGSLSVGISARLKAAEEELRRGDRRKALSIVAEAGRIFPDAVRRLKALAVDLRPPDLDLLGLPFALRQHIQEIGRASALEIEFVDQTGGARIGSETQITLFRAAQECLNNVVKHAGAGRVTVRLSATDALARLTVADNGRGFDPAGCDGVMEGRLGLRAMREMAALLGGEVVIESGVGRGTTVSIALPREEVRA